MYPICRNIQNECFYKYLGENIFLNIITGESGFIEDETARKIFRINIEATQIINEFPLVEEMIKSLRLKFSNT